MVSVGIIVCDPYPNALRKQIVKTPFKIYYKDGRTQFVNQIITIYERVQNILQTLVYNAKKVYHWAHTERGDARRFFYLPGMK